MKAGEERTLSKGYPTKVSHKKGKIIAKAGDRVRLFSDHVEVWIVELKNKDRISVPTKYLI